MLKKRSAPESDYELSMVDLIIIPFKHWKKGIILFGIFYALGIIGFIIKKTSPLPDIGKYSGKIRLVNQVEQGHTWSSGVKVYDEFTDRSLVAFVYDTGKLSEKMLSWPELIIQPNAEKFKFFKNGNELFAITVIVDNLNKNFTFITTLPSVSIRSKEPDLFREENIKKINDLVVNTCITELNKKIKIYRSLREFVGVEMGKANPLKLRTAEEIKNYLQLGYLYSYYNMLEKPYERTKINVNIGDSNLNPRGGINKKFSSSKFLMFLTLIDLIFVLLIIYAVEYFERYNITGEIKKILKKT